MIKSDSEIYTLLEHILKNAGDDPQTAPDIWDNHMEVREHVVDCNKLSDRLGHMWRRGLLDRWYTANSSTSRARYGYTWKEAEEGVLTPRKLEAAKATYLHPVAPQLKPNVTITEHEGSVVLDFPEFTITVLRK